MNIDPFVTGFVQIAAIILVVSILFRFFRLPYIIGHIIAGVLIGPFGFALVSDTEAIAQMGAIGVTLLMFYIGMETSLPDLFSRWKLAIFGTLAQIIISIGAVAVIGMILNWPLNRIILLGFVISLSSTAVVLKILRDKNELNTRIGQNVLTILIMQDIAVIVMVLVLSFMTEQSYIAGKLLHLAGTAGFLVALLLIVTRKNFSIPFIGMIKRDHELQVFAAFILCFGIASVSALFGLSAAIGSFIAGFIVAGAKETEWVQNTLSSFRVIFVALFFVSVGMLIDLGFLFKNYLTLLSLVFAVLVINTFINAGIIRMFDSTWKESIYSGSILAQIGEFSYILAAIGLASGIISQFGYQSTILIISLTLLVSPLWMMTVKWLFCN